MKTITKKLSELFIITSTISHDKSALTEVSSQHDYPYITRTAENNGISERTGLIDEISLNEANSFSLGLLQMDFFFQSEKWYAGQFVRKVIPLFEIDKEIALYFLAYFKYVKQILLKDLVRDVNDTFNNLEIKLPCKDDGISIDFDYMKSFVMDIEKQYSDKIKTFLKSNYQG